MTQTPQAPYRILSLDGGGMDGLFSLLMLDALEQRVPGFLETVTLYAGTSAGAINALALAAYPGEQLRCRQVWEYEQLFKTEPWEVWAYLSGYYPLYGQHYSDFLTKFFAGKTLGDLSTKVALGTFDALGRHREPRFWGPATIHSYDEAHQDLPLASAAMYSSAAPGIRPMIDGYTDGGWGSACPAVPALDVALEQGIELSQIEIFSVGVGRVQQHLTEPNENWGLWQWWMTWWGNNWSQTNDCFTPLLDAALETANRHLRTLLGPERYFRINPAVLELTPLTATVYSGLSKESREWIIDGLRKAMEDPRTQAQIDAAAVWLKEAGWAD